MTTAPPNDSAQAMNDASQGLDEQFALRRYWEQFPVSPGPIADRLMARCRRKFYNSAATDRLGDKFDAVIAQAVKLADDGKTDKAIATFRALFTVILELMEVVDDSYGCVGDCFQEAFKEYRKLLVTTDNFGEEPYLADLLEFMIWEDYGMTYEQSYGWFRELPNDKANIAISYLQQRYSQLRTGDRKHQAQSALTLLAQLAAEQDRFELFSELTKEIGGEHWAAVLMLARSAATAKKMELASEIFEDSIREDRHGAFLNKHYQAFKDGTWKWEPGGKNP